MEYTHFPYITLKDRAKICSKEETLRTNIYIASLLGALVGTTLGPKGLDKLIVRDIGGVDGGRPTRHVIVTNDTAEIVGHLVSNDKAEVAGQLMDLPMTKIFADLVSTIDKEVGDGTTTAVILTSALLKNALKLTERGLSPPLIMKGYLMALDKTLELCDKLAIMLKEKNMEKHCLEIARATIHGKGFSISEEKLVEVAYSAAKAVVYEDSTGVKVNLKNIKFMNCAGNVEKTNVQLVDGVVLKNELVHTGMPKRVKDARIAIFSNPLMWRDYQSSIYDKFNFSSTDISYMREVREGRARFLEEMAESIVKTGANVIFTKMGMDEILINYLSRHGVSAVRRVVDEDVVRLSLATGGRIIPKADILRPEDLGYAKIVEERKIAGSKWMFIEGCKGPKNVSVMIYGSASEATTETEYLMKNALSAVASTMENPKVLPGGGAIQVDLAIRLRAWASAYPSKEQFAIMAFADALEDIPMYLAQNLGLNSMDSLVELRAKHSRGFESACLDALTGQIKDAFEIGILDPFNIVRQVLVSATETASATLRVDGLIYVPRTMEEVVRNKRKERASKGKKPEDWIDEVPH